MKLCLRMYEPHMSNHCDEFIAMNLDWKYYCSYFCEEEEDVDYYAMNASLNLVGDWKIDVLLMSDSDVFIQDFADKLEHLSNISAWRTAGALAQDVMTLLSNKSTIKTTILPARQQRGTDDLRYRTIGIDTEQAKRELAKALGASYMV